MNDHIVPNSIEDYCIKSMKGESEILRALTKETYQRMEMPQMQVGYLEGVFLKLLVKSIKARRVLEIGTFTGYSALCMAEALPDDGSLITCDIDEEATDLAKKYWKQSLHGKKISLKIGRAIETLKTLEGPFDLAFIDADKESYIQYWDAIVPKVRIGGLLVADNVLWSGKVLAPKDFNDFAITKFNEHVNEDQRVEQIMLTVQDGITVAVKRNEGEPPSKVQFDKNSH